MADTPLGPVARSAPFPVRVGNRVGDYAARLQALTGWRRRGMAMLLGALATLALPPFHIFPLLFVAFPGLVWLIEGARRPRGAFFAGWWWGFGFFITGLYWIATAFTVDWVRFGWMIPFIIGGLGAFMAFFVGVASYATRLVPMTGVARVLVLAIAWTLTEWVRGWLLTGFPWNLIGYSWAFSNAMNQFAALAGIWGLSLVTVIGAAMPSVLARLPGAPAAAVRPERYRMVATAAALLLLVGVWGGGAVRLATATDAIVPDVRFRLVQPNIDEFLKNQRHLAEANVARHLRLTADTPGFDRITHSIFPETAVPFLLDRNPDILKALGQTVRPGHLLITGTIRGKPATGDLDEIWNSVVAVDERGTIVGTADKFHLVPLGEYVPLRNVFPFINKLTPGTHDFSAGPGPQTLHLPGLPPVGPLVCYEVIFPGAVANRQDRPSWLLNLTNDGWFGHSTGPYQHFAAARLRAVEEGLPLVRAANTGISGVFDAYGRVRARLGLGAEGVLDADLPVALPPTVYARFGDAASGVLLLLVALLLIPLRRLR